MEKFDIEYFREKNKKDDGSTCTEIKGDTIIELLESNDQYQKHTRYRTSPYVNKKAFSKINYQLIAEVNYFYSFPFGISKKYDEKGNIIEERDWDALFPFSIDKMIDMLKKECKIDLLNSDYKYVTRDYDAKKKINYYTVTVSLLPNPYSDVRELQIDGKTGEIFSDEIIPYEEDY